MNRSREAIKFKYNYKLETGREDADSMLLRVLSCDPDQDRRDSGIICGNLGGCVNVILPLFCDNVTLQGGSIGHLMISAHFLDDVGRKNEHRDIFWEALRCLPNVTRLSIEGAFPHGRRSSVRAFGIIQRSHAMPPVPILTQILQHFRPKLEELHLARVYVYCTCPDQRDRLLKSFGDLTRLRVFRSIDTRIRLFSESQSQSNDNVIWDAVAALPEIETFHLEYSQHPYPRMDPALPYTTRSLSTSKSINHIFLKGPAWSNLGRIARVLIGPVPRQKRQRNGDRKTLLERKSSSLYNTLHLEGPSLNKEGLIAIVGTKSCRVKHLSLVNYGGCDFVDDAIIRSLAKVLRQNVTLEHLHIHPIERVTSVGYGALLSALTSPDENGVPFNGTLGHFPLENVESKFLLRHLRRLLAMNKYRLRRYARVPSPDTKMLHTDLSGLLNSYPRGSLADEKDLLEILFGLFSGNIGLLQSAAVSAAVSG